MTLINELPAAGIDDEQDAIKLKAVLENQNDTLRTLYFFFESKVFTRPANGALFFSMDPYGDYKPEDIKDDTTTYLKLLDILFEHGIIMEVVYQKLKQFVLPGNKDTYLGALYMAKELSSFYKHFTIEKQLEFMELLCGRGEFGRDGILDYRKKAKLTKDIKAGKIETYLDFFRYSHCCELINISAYQGKPKHLLKKLTKILNSLSYPNAFSISNISIYEEDFFGEPSYDNKRTTLIIDSGARKHEFSYTFSVDKDRTYHVILLVLENALTFINRLLADYTCSFRFASVVSVLNKTLFPGSREITAICRIEQSNEYIFEFRAMQERFLRKRPAHLFYRFPLSYTHIEYAIYHFQQRGLLEHLSEEQLNDTISKIYNKTYEDIGDLMIAFPNTIAVVNQKVTSGQKPYFEFIQALNTISRGVLNFNDIYDGLPDQFEYETESEFIVSFTCNEKSHEVICRLNDKNFDQTIIYYIINEIVRKEYPNYQLINIVGGIYGEDYFLFASDQQIDYLNQKKLLKSILRF